MQTIAIQRQRDARTVSQEAATARTTVEVAVISLPTAAERRRGITSMLDGAGWTWHYFDAHKCLADPDLQYDPHEAKTHFGRTLGAQEIAVYSSQYAALKEFLRRDAADYALILEDDVLLDIDFPVGELAALCADRRIHYIRLFGKHFAGATRLGFFYDRSIVRYETSPAGAQAYMVSPEGARNLTANLRSVRATIDLAMDRFWELGLPIYGIFPYPVIERFSPTSIPIPPARDELAPAERLAWTVNRFIDKARKICANAMLGREDARMRRRLPDFAQIYTVPRLRQP